MQPGQTRALRMAGPKEGTWCSSRVLGRLPLGWSVAVGLVLPKDAHGSQHVLQE